MYIGKHKIGNANTFIVAELSANHNQRYDVAVDSIKAAHRAGADAIKLQTYTPDTLTIDCNSDHFKLPDNSLWRGKTLYELYGEAYTPWEWHGELQKLTNSLGMEFFSSPFDPTAADYLHKLNVPAYKIASFEIFDIPLIKKVAALGKPIIVSTGVAEIQDIQDAVDACQSVGNKDIILLKCSSAYPAPIDEMNLSSMQELRELFNVYVGFSDHSLGIVAPVVAASLGAVMIEKHFILDKNLGGPDAAFSLDANEFAEMVQAVRVAKTSIGDGIYKLTANARQARNMGRSLFVVSDMVAGEVFTEKNIRSIRPAAGLQPKYLPDILGKKAKSALKRGTPLNWNFIE